MELQHQLNQVSNSSGLSYPCDFDMEKNHYIYIICFTNILALKILNQYVIF